MANIHCSSLLGQIRTIRILSSDNRPADEVSLYYCEDDNNFGTLLPDYVSAHLWGSNAIRRNPGAQSDLLDATITGQNL